MPRWHVFYRIGSCRCQQLHCVRAWHVPERGWHDQRERVHTLRVRHVPVRQGADKRRCLPAVLARQVRDGAWGCQLFSLQRWDVSDGIWDEQPEHLPFLRAWDVPNRIRYGECGKLQPVLFWEISNWDRFD